MKPRSRRVGREERGQAIIETVLVTWLFVLLLVILLHCHAGSADGSTGLQFAVPETLGALSQLTGSITLLGASLVVLWQAGSPGLPALGAGTSFAGWATLSEGRVEVRGSLGGLLRYYYRKAA